jgi:tRNA-splicing ligase RtcB
MNMQLDQISDVEWRLPRKGRMFVDGLLFASEPLVRAMDDKVFSQMANVASLPGIVGASLAMPDAHSGYGFPIGGVAAFDPEAGGVVSAGGVGFDIACGVRTLLTGLHAEDLKGRGRELGDLLFAKVPCGLGQGGPLTVKGRDMDALLRGGAGWAVKNGFGEQADLERCEERGTMPGALPEHVSTEAKERQKDQVGTLGSGNHYLEVQAVAEIFDPDAADAFGLRPGDVLVSIHCGSRGLGHQIGQDFLKRMVQEAPGHGIALPDKELACAPVRSDLGQEYLGAMRSGVNCALANRQVITHLVRQAFAAFEPQAVLRLLYDVSHNTCKEEEHMVNGVPRKVFVHRKGATRAWGPGHPGLPEPLRRVGQPVLVGGSMGTESYILAGMESSRQKSFSSANHGAGRALSRSQAKKRFRGNKVVEELAGRDIHIRAPNYRGVAEEAPGAYKDVSEVVRVAEQAGLARKVARVLPLVCVKG